MAAPVAIVDLTPALLATVQHDEAMRKAAEQHLAALQTQNYPSFIASLSTELANPSKPATARQAAGLALKNVLDAKEDVRKRELQAAWTQLDPVLRQHVRDALLSTLGADDQEVRHTSAMVVAKVAAVDLPRREWPTLIQALLSNMGAPGTGPALRHGTLDAMGFVCEEMNAVQEVVLSTPEINMILTAVVLAMGPEEPDLTKLAATIALTNAIEFAQHNFENDNERNYLMQVVCQGTTCSDERIRVASFECLHEIAALYYSKLVPYMTQIYNITLRAVKEDKEEVGLQALEFWNTVAEEEYDLLDTDEASCHHFMKAAAPHLVPILLELLTKQDEGQEDDDTAWNLSVAGGTCLGLAARVVGNDIVPIVMPFIQANISKNTVPEDWRLREAATFAFGLILDGPEPSCFTDTIKQALGFLLQAIRDPHPHVKDTTAWTLGRMFEFLHDNSIEPPIITRDTLPSIVSVLLESLRDRPHIAYRVCCAISQLASGFRYSQGGTSPLSPFFKDAIAALLQCAQRHAGHENSNVQISAFEAVNDLVRSASRDTLDVVAQLIQVVLPEIRKTFELGVQNDAQRDKQAEIQGQLCGVLQVIVQKLSEEEDTKAAVLPYADNIMETILSIFSGRSATVHEEAMLAVGSFTYALGNQFSKYLVTFMPYLRTGLTNYQEWQVCLSTVGVLGDVCRNVEELMLPYCDDVMSILITNLGREDVHRTIKPQILSSFGDIALVIGDKFVKYLDAVLRVLRQAMSLSIEQARKSEADYVEYNNQLRVGIIEAYSGLIQGLGPIKATQCLRGEVTSILDFLSSIGNEIAGQTEPDEDVAKSAVNLLGDICSCMHDIGSVLKESPNKHWNNILGVCRTSDSMHNETEWALQQIDQIMR